jgi:hypothetical protein
MLIFKDLVDGSLRKFIESAQDEGKTLDHESISLYLLLLNDGKYFNSLKIEIKEIIKESKPADHIIPRGWIKSKKLNKGTVGKRLKTLVNLNLISKTWSSSEKANVYTFFPPFTQQ